MSDSNEEDRVAVPDYSDDSPPPDEDSMRRLTRLVLEMGQLEMREHDLTQELESVQKQLKSYQENLVPSLMAEIGIKTLETKSGIVVELRDEVRASFPKDEEKRQRAFAYLEQTGDDGLIKREFSVRYGRDSIAWAKQFAQWLEETGVKEHATVEEDWSINHQTLLAYLRRQLRDGADVPLDAFGSFVQSFAKIKRGK